MKSILSDHLVKDVTNTVLDYCVAHKEENMNVEFRSSFLRIEYDSYGRRYGHGYYYMNNLPIQYRLIASDYYLDLEKSQCRPVVMTSDIKSFISKYSVAQSVPERYIFSLHWSDLI